MEREQFLKFRMSLLPASGFQSAQYRKIEISSTDFLRLVHKDVRENYTGNESIAELFEHIYWKEGATEIASGKKTLTLIEFEDREDFINEIKDVFIDEIVDVWDIEELPADLEEDEESKSTDYSIWNKEKEVYKELTADNLQQKYDAKLSKKRNELTQVFEAEKKKLSEKLSDYIAGSPV
jgi:tryptophan 2,3-dioxygenase